MDFENQYQRHYAHTQIMALFKPGRFSDKRDSLAEPHPFSNLPLIIASGLGRSGTTVLRHCIAAHSQIASQNEECNYIHDLMRAADTNLDEKNHRKTLPVSQKSYWQLHRQLLLNLYWPMDQFDATANPRALSTYSMLDPRAAIGLKKRFSFPAFIKGRLKGLCSCELVGDVG